MGLRLSPDIFPGCKQSCVQTKLELKIQNSIRSLSLQIFIKRQLGQYCYELSIIGRKKITKLSGRNLYNYVDMIMYRNNATLIRCLYHVQKVTVNCVAVLF